MGKALQKTFLNGFILILIHLAWQVSAQSGYFEFIKQSQELSSSYIDCVFQDSYGYIWIGTEFGLNGYHGSEIYTIEIPNHPHTISSAPGIFAIIEDQHQNLWMASNLGVLQYDLNRKVFKWYYLGEENQADNVVTDIFIDTNNNIFVASSKGCYFYSLANDSFIKMDIPILDEISIIYLCKQENGIFWFSNHRTLIKWDSSTRRVKKYQHDVLDNYTLGDLNISKLFLDSENNLWVALSTGINKYIPEDDHFERHEPVGGVIDIVQDNSGYLWLATWEDGLCKYNPHTQEFKQYKNHPDKPHTIISNSLRSVFFDAAQNLWIGTNGSGIVIFKEDYWRFNHFYQIPGNNNSLSSNLVKAFSEKGDMIWIGTENGGLNSYNRQSGEFQNFQYLDLPFDKRDHLSVISLAVDQNDNIWVGTLGGLNRFNPSRKGYEPVYLSCFQGEDPPQIWTIKNGPQKQLWLGTSKGLVIYNPADNSSMLYSHSSQQSGALSNNQIPALLFENESTLWIGTKNGLNLYDLSTGIVQQFFHSYSDSLTIGSNSINAIHKTAKGDIWIATNAGLSRFHASTGTFSNFSYFNWPHNVIFGILEDQTGALWVSTLKGILHVAHDGSLIKAFNMDDGLQDNHFLSGAFLRASDGEMYFGGVNGFNAFYPDRIKTNSIPPLAVISEIHINNNIVDINTPKSPLSSRIEDVKRLILTFGQNSFNLGFFSTNYIQPEKNNYEYMLEGFDKDWVKSHNRQTAYYTNVPYGSYTFLVRASNNDGIWSENVARLDIKILPPYYATWWARIVYFLIPLVLLYFFKHYSFIAIEAKNKIKLDQLEKDKIKEVYDLKMQFFMNISHEFRTPLTLIIDPIENGIKQLNDTSPLKKVLTISLKNAYRLLELINQLLEFRTIESGNARMQVGNYDIVGFVREITDSFEETAKTKNIRLELKSHPGQIMTWFDAKKMDRIMLNLLSNAFKYTPNDGRISVYLSIQYVKAEKSNFLCKVGLTKSVATTNIVRIEVEDTGFGIPRHLQKRIFDRFYQIAPQNKKIETGTGLGLSLVNDLVKLHKGRIKVSSTENIGSRFTIDLPLGKSHFEEHEILLENEITLSENESATLLNKQLSYFKPLPKVSPVMDKKKEVILFVDDNTDITDYVFMNLSAGYNVLIAQNGKEGLELAKKHIPDVVITDIMMPIMDGITFTKHIKKDELTRHIPIIMLTAKTTYDSQLEGFSQGATDYLIKPFKIDLLELKIRNILADRASFHDNLKKMLTQPDITIEYKSPDDAFLKKLYQLIEENISDSDFEVDNIVREIGISRAQLYRKISSLTGQSVKQFVRNIRMRTAARLLSNKDIRVIEVMGMVGINNRAYFIKCFKEIYGVSPSEYLKTVDV